MKKRSPDEGATEDLDDARGEWFARQLGERWQPDGEGIYRYVDDFPTRPRARDRLSGTTSSTPSTRPGKKRNPPATHLRTNRQRENRRNMRG